MMRMYAATLYRIVALMALFILYSSTASAINETVSLKLKKGGLVFTGTLVGFNGKAFIIQTSKYGRLSLDARRFRCISKNCNTLLEIFMVRKKGGSTVHKQPSHYISMIRKVSPDFSIHGSNTIGTRLMPALINGFARLNGFTVIQRGTAKNKEVKFFLRKRNGKVLSTIDLKRHGSSTAFPSLEKDLSIIGMSDRRISREEVKRLKAAGFPGMRTIRREHVIGVDGILIIVSHKNTVTSLSLDQLAKIFSGKITNWSEVGGTPGQIKVYAPDKNSGTFSTFKSLVLKPGKLQLIKNAVRYASNVTLSQKVADDERAIGITGFAYKGQSKAISIASSCGILNAPTRFNVSTNEYPLSRRLYLYTTRHIKNKYAFALLNFSKDPKNTNAILKNAGFIGRNISMQPFHEQGQRMSGMFNSPSQNFDLKLMRKLSKDLRHGSRLSATIRFHPNSFAFDSESQQVFGKLGKFIIENKLENNYFIFAGFSDSIGLFDKNLELSRSRAAQVAEKFKLATRGFIDPNKVIVKAYGELLPVSCNDTRAGRARNRRVEIWTVRPEHWPKEKPKIQQNQFTQNFPSQ